MLGGTAARCHDANVAKWTLLGLSVAALCVGCELNSPSDGSPEADSPAVVDERAGEYGGVGLGASGERVEEQLGDSERSDGFFPLDSESFTGPPSIPTPGGRPEVLKYEESAFLVARKGGVVALMVTAEGVATRAGVAVGEPLERVEEAYSAVRCGEAPAGEAVVGEDPTYPWCRATVGDVKVFFGGDPIESVTLTRR